MKIIFIMMGLLSTSYNVFAQETLQTVTDRGNVTTNALSVGGGYVNANTTKLFINNSYGKKFALSSGANMVSEEGFHIYNWTDNSDYPFFSISNSGNIGIGTFLPKAKLDVRGDILMSQGILPMGLITEMVETTTPLLNLSLNFRGPERNNSYRGAAFRIDTRLENNSPLFQWLSRNAGTENESIMMTLNAEGNLGIGTLSPKERLSINGEIRAHEIKVETKDWPDYVFEDSYVLKPLAEVASYIKINKKLPELPAAAEAEAEGIDLGQINKLLVKKVEELTLYLIEKDAELKEQNARQNILESSLDKQKIELIKLQQDIATLLKNK